MNLPSGLNRRAFTGIRFHPTPYINVLPDDILVDIFLILTRIGTRVSYPKILTSVCSRWRELALHTPLLWTKIKIALYSAQSCRNALDYFEHSKPALIDVRFHNYGKGRPAVPEYRESIYNALVYHASRLRKLVLRLPSQNEISSVLDGWASTDADVGNLEYVSIRFATGKIAKFAAFTPWKGIQALRSLDIHDFDISSLPPLPNLNFLSVDPIDSRPETFQILFAKYPLLERLVIHYLEQSHAVEQHAHQAINLPRSLRSLSVYVEDTEKGEECRCILPQLLEADTLEHVEIEGCYGASVLGGHHASMFTRWKHTQRPRTLLIHCHMLQFGDISVLAGLPDTVDLELEDIFEREFKDRGGIVVAVLALTNLHSLTVNLRVVSWSAHYSRWGERPSSLETFRKLVRERRPVLGSPTFLRVDEQGADKELEAEMQKYIQVPVGGKLTVVRTPRGAPQSVLDKGPGVIDADPDEDPCYSDEDDSGEGEWDSEEDTGKWDWEEDKWDSEDEENEDDSDEEE